jgi:starch synthase
METVKKLGWSPDIIHCQGWMTSLIPLYLKTIYKDEPVFRNTKVIYSVYHENCNDNLGEDFVRKASMNSIDEICSECFENSSLNELNVGAVKHSDGVVTNCDEAHRSVESHLEGKLVMKHSDVDAEQNYVAFYKQFMP